MISAIRLQNFRSYKDASFEVADGVNIIVGPNASGKTNLLEAILVSATGSSYRVKDEDLIKYGSQWARLDVYKDDGLRILKLENINGKLNKTTIINDKPHKRLSLKNKLPVVLFEPNHLQLLQGSPERRREFLDDLLEQINPSFGQTRRHYKRALTQRNNLLKQNPKNAIPQMFVWNIRLGELGGYIAQQRMDLIKRMNKQLPELYEKLAGAPKTTAINYSTKCDQAQYGSHLHKLLEASAEQDFARGFTAYGPHRDDFELILGGHDASQSASRGETRTLMLGLKIIEMRVLEDVSGKRPILLLDDVFSELDGARRRHLANFFKNHQTFITTTDADVVVQHFAKDYTIIPLSIDKR